MLFHKAKRQKAKLRLGICGPSGSGKTYSALLIAKGIGGRVALLDTEYGAGELYSDSFDYDVASLSSPFSPQKYIDVIKKAEEEGYNALIIDSLSHAWCGTGGVLNMVDNVAAGSPSRNSYFAWREVTPQHNALVEAMLKSSLHIIVTMRSKTAYEVVKDEKGRCVPVKIGLAPIQRDGMEYEFTVVLDLYYQRYRKFLATY